MIPLSITCRWWRGMHLHAVQHSTPCEPLKPPQRTTVVRGFCVPRSGYSARTLHIPLFSSAPMFLLFREAYMLRRDAKQSYMKPSVRPSCGILNRPTVVVIVRADWFFLHFDITQTNSSHAGNTYSIRNVGSGTARVFFAQAREMNAQDEE